MSSMVINGAAIFSAIAQKPGELSFSEAQVNDLALSVLVAKLKDKGLEIDQLRKLAATVGDADFKLILEHLPPKDAMALVKRLDAKNSELKGADEAWTRSRAAALILGGADPSAPSPKVKTPARGAAASKTGKALQSKALKPRVPKKTSVKQDIT